MVYSPVYSAVEREGEDAQSDVIVVPLSHPYSWWSPASLEMAEHLTAEEKYWIHCSTLPIKLSLSQPISFFNFTLQILSPISLAEGNVQVTVWGWDDSWG